MNLYALCSQINTATNFTKRILKIMKEEIYKTLS